jgi:protein N-terminal methyltransferase
MSTPSAINSSEPVHADPATVFEKYKSDWYETSSAYWAKQTPSVDGMLGGYEQLTGFDCFHSRDLIEKYQTAHKNPLGKLCVADCGCGIGRVSHYVLSDYFSEIDLIDPVEHFLTEAVKLLSKSKVTVRQFVSGAQDWVPDRAYDAFWIQWVIMYMTDDDAVAFLQRCKAHLRPNGKIFVKDNLGSKKLDKPKERAEFFEEDRGICRVYSHYLELFASAGVKVVESERQKGWPEDMLALFTWVLQ